MTSSTPSSPSDRSSRPIAREVALGFAFVSVIAVSMCAMLLVMLNDVAGDVETMREDETSIRGSLELATAVREQYIHLAHALLNEDGSHLDHYETWVTRVRQSADDLKSSFPPAEHARFDQIIDASRTMDTVFRTELLPEALAGRRSADSEAHARVERLSEQAAAQADALVHFAEQHMAAAHTDATSATRVGLLSGVLCVGLVLVVSIGWTLRLRKALLEPLHVLVAAAERIGAGDFDARVGTMGPHELSVVGAAMDRMTEELERREARLMRTERMAAIGQLAAAVAHELNNPIGIIRGYLKTMSVHGDPKALEDELAILDEEAAACQRIASDLLAYSRLPAGRVSVVDAQEFLESAVDRLRQDPALQDASISVHASAAKLAIDVERMRQVLANLLRNAAQASAGGAALEVEGDRVDGRYEIRVLDRGKGIADAVEERLFEPFYSTGTGGTGLGLAVCESIVGQHRGTIELRSREGGGAVARVRLPLVGEEESSV